MKAATDIALISMISALALSACGGKGETSVDGKSSVAEWSDITAPLIGREGELLGEAGFKQAPLGGVLIRINLNGLSQGWHGAHLHQIGDCSDGEAGFKFSGGHIDPDQREHGFLNRDGPERADLPNIYTGENGRATAEIYNDSIMLFASEEAAVELGPYPLIDEDGFALVVHANPDDHVSQPIGGAGERVACAAFTQAR